MNYEKKQRDRKLKRRLRKKRPLKLIHRSLKLPEVLFYRGHIDML